MNTLFALASRRNALAFWLGAVLVTIGVILHLPMFMMAKDMSYALAGMTMDPGMYWGMALIVLGIALAAYGLIPAAPEGHTLGRHQKILPPEDARLSPAHWTAAIALAIGLIIDIMKPASLGFVTPGMRAEYQVTKAVVAFLPLSALIGTVVGSFVWGALADIYGRRASILLSAVMYIGTSICGTMPSLWWNVAMCFLMGAAAGGMLPVTYALLAEIMPTKYRGLSLVLIGGIGAVGGYLAASGLSAWLQPLFGWRIMWFLNLPTGIILVALSIFIPESPRFLIHIGQVKRAYEVLSRFGAVVVAHTADTDDDDGLDHSYLPPVERRYLGTTVALTLAALSWGFVNFGLLLWIPSELVAEGNSVGLASAIIAQSSLVAIPTVAIAAWCYSSWSTKYALIAALVITALGLLATVLRGTGVAALSNPIIAIALLIVGATGVISILLPYAAENYPLRIRGRATGWIAGCSKLGGLICQALSVLALVPALWLAALIIALPALLAMILIRTFGQETRGRDLRELEDVAVVSSPARL